MVADLRTFYIAQKIRELVTSFDDVAETAEEAQEQWDTDLYRSIGAIPTLDIKPADFLNLPTVEQMVELEQKLQASGKMLTLDAWHDEIPMLLFDLEQHGRDARASLVHKFMDGMNWKFYRLPNRETDISHHPGMVMNFLPPPPSDLTKYPNQTWILPDRRRADAHAIRLLEDGRIFFQPAHVVNGDWMLPWDMTLEPHSMASKATIDEVMSDTQFVFVAHKVAEDLFQVLIPQLPARQGHELVSDRFIWFHRHLKNMWFVCECCNRRLRKPLRWHQLVCISF